MADACVASMCMLEADFCVAEECSSMGSSMLCDYDCLIVAAMLCSRDGIKGPAGASCKRSDCDQWDTIKILGVQQLHASMMPLAIVQYVNGLVACLQVTSTEKEPGTALLLHAGMHCMSVCVFPCWMFKHEIVC